MSIKDKITPGEWYTHDHHIRVDQRSGTIGQSFVIDTPRHENKFAVDAEGLANAKLWATSKSMLDIIERLAATRKLQVVRKELEWAGLTSDAINLLKKLNNE